MLKIPPMMVTISPMILVIMAILKAISGVVWNTRVKSTVMAASDVPMPPTVMGMSVTTVAMDDTKMKGKNEMFMWSACAMR